LQKLIILIDTPFIDVHTHQKMKPSSGFISVINLFANETVFPTQENNTFFSIGLHPWHIAVETQHSIIKNIEQLLKNQAIIAIGETGLDRAIQTPMELQKEVFQQHLVLAQTFEKPVIIHAVRSYPDIIEVYNKSRIKVKMIFHGFNGNISMAEQLLKRGFCISFGEDLFDSNRKAAELTQTIPLENLFLETDESEKSIAAIYEQAAKIKGISLNELKENIYQNFINCFGKII